MTTGLRSIVFGGTRGLGLATALALAAEGGSVLVASRDAATVAEAVALIRDRSRAAAPLGIRCDVSCPADVDATVSKALDIWSGIDAVVNCAGVLGPAGPTDQVDWDAWRTAVQINLFGPALVSRAII